MRQIILDTETTGLDPDQGDRVVELGCVEVINRELTGNNLHIYFNPDRDSSPEALAVHGLTTAFLSQHGRFKDEAQRIAAYLEGAEIIIHNAAFDTKFLNAEFAKVGMPSVQSIAGLITDTLAMARERFPGKRNNLDVLCERFDISNKHRILHGALLDAELLAEVWLAMTRGQFGLLIEETAEQGMQKKSADKLALDALVLPVIRPSEPELQAHQEYLDALDKASGKTCLWRELA